jgi:hypothetical protein
MKFKVFARRLDNGNTIEKPGAPLYESLEEAKEAGRAFMLEKMDETGTGWMWHVEEINE